MFGVAWIDLEIMPAHSQRRDKWTTGITVRKIGSVHIAVIPMDYIKLSQDSEESKEYGEERKQSLKRRKFDLRISTLRHAAKYDSTS